MIDGHLKCDCLNDMVRYVKTGTFITSEWRNWLAKRKNWLLLAFRKFRKEVVIGPNVGII